MIFVDIIGAIVEAMRTTGTITAVVTAGDISTCQSANHGLVAGDIIVIAGSSYTIISAGTNDFTVEGAPGRGEIWVNESPYYLYGHPLEIFNILKEKSKSETFKYSKYPLVALYQDYEENINNTVTTIKGVTIVIMTETSRTYTAPNRFTNTFTPTLHPLYELLIAHIKRSKYLNSADYQHTKIDRMYWGKEDTFGNSGNIGNDALDAIVIKIDLEIIKKC